MLTESKMCIRDRLDGSQSTVVDRSLIEQVRGGKVKENLRAYTMVFALLAIWLVLAVATQGTFLEPRNLSNLFRQTAINGYLAIGMVFVITAGHIEMCIRDRWTDSHLAVSFPLYRSSLPANCSFSFLWYPPQPRTLPSRD